MKHSALIALTLILATPQVFAAGSAIDPNGLTQQSKAQAKARMLASETLTTAITLPSACTDYGSGYGYCSGPIDHININQGVITFTMALPASELSKLSCNGGAGYANFYLADTRNYDELYDGLRYALAHNNQIRIGVTSSGSGCTVSYLHIFPAS